MHHRQMNDEDTFHSGPLEDQILSYARYFVSMTENHEFQDQPSSH